MRDENLIKTALKEATFDELVKEVSTREDIRMTAFVPVYDKCLEQLNSQSLSPQDLYYLAEALSICLAKIMKLGNPYSPW